MAGEFKWTNKKVGMNTLKNLKEKCKKAKVPAQKYALISKNGFSEELYEEKNVILGILDKKEGFRILKE